MGDEIEAFTEGAKAAQEVAKTGRALVEAGSDLARFVGKALGTVPEDTAELISSHLLECDECEATVERLELESDTVIEKLRKPQVTDPYAGEEACQRAVAVSTAMRSALTTACGISISSAELSGPAS